MGWKEDLERKLREILVGAGIWLLRWLLEKLVGNPGHGDDDAAGGE